MLADADRELTLRGILLGIALTFVFTAANIYLGLKVGLTFSTAIPAAVISMALLSAFRGSNIRENNIVQTLASSAGAMASVIFVLPGLVIVGWWTGFPFWTSFLLCAAGGIIGVIFTIPLRRALVTKSDLPYPEGVAGAEVLRVGSDSRSKNPEAREGLLALVYGALASLGMAVAAATRIALEGAHGFFRVGAGATGYTFSYSLALMGAGHLVGISVGIAMLLGITIAWAIAVPILTAITPQDTAALGDFVSGIWRTKVRFIGAGAMAVAAIWSLARTVRPILAGLAEVVRSQRETAGPPDQGDRDLSLRTMTLLVAGCTLVLALLVWRFADVPALADNALALTLVSIPIILLGGFLIAAICGYMAGLIGSSNSPVSGVGILAAVGCSLCFIAVVAPNPSNSSALVAAALFVTSILFAGAVCSNDNLQDLKTGQLVGASPRRQQIALLIGVTAASLTVPLVLNLLAQAYGFAGAPNLNTVTAQPLPAPQANLISALAQGVIGHSLEWTMIGIGAGIGLAIILLDTLTRAKGWVPVPPLAAGFGIYLPMSVTAPVIVGAFLGWLYERRARSERVKRLGVLMASGLIVGESLFGLVNAGLIVGLNRDAPLALVGPDFAAAPWLGLVGFAAGAALLYAWLLRRARPAE